MLGQLGSGPCFLVENQMRNVLLKKKNNKLDMSAICLLVNFWRWTCLWGRRGPWRPIGCLNTTHFHSNPNSGCYVRTVREYNPKLPIWPLIGLPDLAVDRVCACVRVCVGLCAFACCYCACGSFQSCYVKSFSSSIKPASSKISL